MASGKYRGPKGQIGKIRLNPNGVAELRKKIAAAHAEMVADLDYEYQVVIQDPDAFNSLGFFDQDIVDTGRFRDSQKVDSFFAGNKLISRWEWAPVSPDDGYHYAAALYFGFHPWGNQNAYVPGRPWVEVALKNINPVKRLALELRKQGVPARVIRNNISTLTLP